MTNDYELLRQYGYEIGMAFQMVDDILDFTGEQATMGKPVASDLRQGLITLPAIYYLESNPKEQLSPGNAEEQFLLMRSGLVNYWHRSAVVGRYRNHSMRQTRRLTVGLQALE